MIRMTMLLTTPKLTPIVTQIVTLIVTLVVTQDSDSHSDPIHIPVNVTDWRPTHIGSINITARNVTINNTIVHSRKRKLPKKSSKRKSKLIKASKNHLLWSIKNFRDRLTCAVKKVNDSNENPILTPADSFNSNLSPASVGSIVYKCPSEPYGIDFKSYGTHLSCIMITL